MNTRMVNKMLGARREMMTAGFVHQLLGMDSAKVRSTVLYARNPDVPDRSVVRSIVNRSADVRFRQMQCATDWFSEGLSDSGLLGVYYPKGRVTQAENLVGLLESELDTRLSYDTHTFFEEDEQKVKEYLDLRCQPFNGTTVLATEAFLWQNRFLFLGADGTKVIAPSVAVKTGRPATFSLPSALSSLDKAMLHYAGPNDGQVEKAGAIVENAVSGSAVNNSLDDILESDGTKYAHGSWYYTSSLFGWIMDPASFVFSLAFRKYGTAENGPRFYFYDHNKTVRLTDEGDIEMLKGNIFPPVFFSRPAFYANIDRNGTFGFTLTAS